MYFSSHEEGAQVFEGDWTCKKPFTASPGLAVADVMVQTSSLVKHEGGNSVPVMGIWLETWEDRETVPEGSGMGHSSVKGLIPE